MTYLSQLLPSELCERLAPAGLTAEEGRRIYAHHVHHLRAPWEVRNLAKWKIAAAQAAAPLPPPLEVVTRERSAVDGFMKYLFRLHDGEVIEAVRIPIFDDKYTVCISSQVGCALACAFCATGRLGFTRNLQTWEIVEQLNVVRREADRPVRGVVFMGMGEPLLNYDNVVRAARIMCDPSGMAIDGRKITISTAGVVPAIRRFTAERLPFRLAVSLTAATPEKRRRLMPVEQTWALDELMAAVREHQAVSKERVMLEYVAIAGVNCGADDARDLKALLGDLPVRFNLIEVNDATREFLPPDDAELGAFRDALRILQQPVVRRYSGGKDVQAGCGMLASGVGGGKRLPLAQ